MAIVDRFLTLSQWQEWEATLLPHADKYDADKPYFTGDNSVGEFICERGIMQRLFERSGENSTRPLQVLEVGCGQGANLLEIYNQYANLVDQGQIQLTGTLLQPISSEQQLSNQIEIIHGIEIQRMPNDWENEWDIVLTQRVLGWVHEYGKLDTAFQQIRRIIRPGGIWLGFESYSAMSPSGLPLDHSIEGALKKMKMWQLSAQELYRVLGHSVKQTYDHSGYVYYKQKDEEENPKDGIYQLLIGTGSLRHY